MPISNIEWDNGAQANSESAMGTTPVGEYDDETELIVAFLSEKADNAYTQTEIIRGADFGNDAAPETIHDVLTEIQDELVDLVGDVVTSGMMIDDIDEVLGELTAEGVVATEETKTGDRTTYYSSGWNCLHARSPDRVRLGVQ
jgi:hypothetical protein